MQASAKAANGHNTQWSYSGRMVAVSGTNGPTSVSSDINAQKVASAPNGKMNKQKTNCCGEYPQSLPTRLGPCERNRQYSSGAFAMPNAHAVANRHQIISRLFFISKVPSEKHSIKQYRHIRI